MGKYPFFHSHCTSPFFSVPPTPTSPIYKKNFPSFSPPFFFFSTKFLPKNPHLSSQFPSSRSSLFPSPFSFPYPPVTLYVVLSPTFPHPPSPFLPATYHLLLLPPSFPHPSLLYPDVTPHLFPPPFFHQLRLLSFLPTSPHLLLPPVSFPPCHFSSSSSPLSFLDRGNSPEK